MTQIQTAAQTVAQEVTAADATAQTMAAAVKNVLATVGTMQQAAKENGQAVATLGTASAAVSEGAQNVTQMINRQSSSIHDTREGAVRLNDMAVYLNDLVLQFPLDDRTKEYAEDHDHAKHDHAKNARLIAA